MTFYLTKNHFYDKLSLQLPRYDLALFLITYEMTFALCEARINVE